MLKGVDFRAQSSDPFGNEPRRHPVLIPTSIKPYNAETPLPLLPDAPLTPNDLFYVRNHLPTPDLDPKAFEMEVIGIDGDTAKEFKLADIKKLPKYSVTATIQCGGNRRAEMNKARQLKGLSWDGGAIGNATWTGARLVDVLAAAGVKNLDELSERSDVHVIFEGADTGADGSSYGASVPAWRALDPRADILLAYEMNGAPLPRDHGAPLRVVVPGSVGARSVKWLTRIELATQESQSHWQQNDYKVFGPSTDWDRADFSKVPPIQSMPVTSLVCSPTAGSVMYVETPIPAILYAGAERSSSESSTSPNTVYVRHTFAARQVLP